MDTRGDRAGCVLTRDFGDRRVAGSVVLPISVWIWLRKRATDDGRPLSRLVEEGVCLLRSEPDRKVGKP